LPRRFTCRARRVRLSLFDCNLIRTRSHRLLRKRVHSVQIVRWAQHVHHQSAVGRRGSRIDIDGRVALSDAAGVLRDIGLGKGPGKSLVAFGYAGWAPSQLEDEMARGAWVAVPEDPALVFDDDRAKVWNDALALHKTGR